MMETIRYPHLPIGLALTLFFWVASWMRLGVMGEYAFFPQWLGYILAVDALVAWRRGASLLMRAPGAFLGLFVLSAPVWWIFEGLNNFVVNWHYLGGEQYTAWQIILISTIDFSTVLPAVFETTELLSTFDLLNRFRTRRRWRLTRHHLWALMYAGALAFAGVVLLPHFAFPFVWIWLALLLDPLNALRGRPSLVHQLARGDWRMIVALALAVTVCAFFWEMWNFLAWPKWYYTVPFAGAAKIFEMPLLGYFGYWPFAWELYALYHLIFGRLNRPADVLSLDAEMPVSESQSFKAQAHDLQLRNPGT